MKLSYYFLFPCLALFFIGGCSFSSRLSQYKSSSDFYDKFNDKMKDRPVDVVTKDGRTIASDDGAEVFNDTVYLVKKNVSKSGITVPLKLIKSIQYSEYYADELSGVIQLNDGSIHEAEYIKVIPDSLQFTDLHRYETKTPLHINEIEKVTYTKRWVAVPAGFIGGFLSGIAIGFLKPFSIYEGPHGTTYYSPGPERTKSTVSNVFICAVSGSILGSIVGYIIGFDYNYYF